MPAARPWTAADDQHLRDLAAAGHSVRDMAAELDRSKTAVGRRMQHLGILVDRTATLAATTANVTDARGRRAALELALLEDAERLRSQLWRPHLYWDWGGKDHDYDEKEAPEPIPSDKLKLVQAAGAAIDRSLKIAVHDADGGIVDALSMLDGIANAITAAADQDGAP
ncbi:hypothetical protein GCM10025864_44990 [Luteimicrobium album]|uniref:Helix-turn-helix domain-containing protein n=1 Tax=Luteimicrobium album TaxID=1054550 RepID=A0ABQ6I9Q1_9MICO|nr:hypothetical protein [Luteimicrobium album]GMA22273.1 hypothetical protein GCM10025864_00320 [Luteimicrobium album]GMA26678.1 hypothetical protein GCM10025864_44370 [Luteimicrobium album]GMA26740.1 hypothetical protein GCM10025864_44990 [Luteimicrobium album]